MKGRQIRRVTVAKFRSKVVNGREKAGAEGAGLFLIPPALVV